MDELFIDPTKINAHKMVTLWIERYNLFQKDDVTDDDLDRICAIELEMNKIVGIESNGNKKS